MKQKKRQIMTIWMANNKQFTTFKAFKRWLWYNLHTGETLEGCKMRYIRILLFLPPLWFEI